MGDVIDDTVVRPESPMAAGTDTPARIDVSPGGSGANQAVWLARAGARVTFVGKVGAGDVDRHGAVFADAGVTARLAVDRDRPTGRIVVLVDDDGQRSMFTDRGANRSLSADDLPDDVLDSADLFHVSGYSLFEPTVRSAVQGLMDHARRRDVPISVDPSSTGFLVTVRPRPFLDWVAGTTVLVPNLDEGRLLTGREDPDDVVTALRRRFPVVALTLGPDGAIAAAGDDRVAVPGRATHVVDTTGAGDAFCAGFLTTWLATRDLRAATEAGVTAGTEAVGHPGGRPRP